MRMIPKAPFFLRDSWSKVTARTAAKRGVVDERGTTEDAGAKRKAKDNRYHPIPYAMILPTRRRPAFLLFILRKLNSLSIMGENIRRNAPPDEVRRALIANAPAISEDPR